MEHQISGNINKFKFIGTYNPTTETFSVEIPEDTIDFVFEVDENGIAFVYTEQK